MMMFQKPEELVQSMGRVFNPELSLRENYRNWIAWVTEVNGNYMRLYANDPRITPEQLQDMRVAEEANKIFIERFDEIFAEAEERINNQSEEAFEQACAQAREADASDELELFDSIGRLPPPEMEALMIEEEGPNPFSLESLLNPRRTLN